LIHRRGSPKTIRPSAPASRRDETRQICASRGIARRRRRS
jgi:hypothetical protein